MKKIFYSLICFFTYLCTFALAMAAPYGPTLNEVVTRYSATRSFDMLNESLSKERINIRLGMTVAEVEFWAAKSKLYHITSRKGSIYKFESKDFDVSRISFQVWFAKGQVVVIKTYNVNNFDADDSELMTELKALRPVRVNECWVDQNFVDPNSYSNGFDFVLMTQRNNSISSDEGCMGSDRANITIGKPGILYPKHIVVGP